MPVELIADVEMEPGHEPLAAGWRGVADFNERWAEADADLWYPPGAPVPVGEPMTYGCELGEDAGDGRVTLRFWFGDDPRRVMSAGSKFTLRDGRTVRATGTVVSARSYAAGS